MRLLYTQGVTGSSPVSPSSIHFTSACGEGVYGVTPRGIRLVFIFFWFRIGRQCHDKINLDTIGTLFHARSLESQIDPLPTMAEDWSAWDDTYAFVADHNSAYFESTLPPSSFVTLP